MGWCCGFEIWNGADGFEICGCADLFGCVLFLFFIFFKVALVDVGLFRWWLASVVAVGGHCCGSGGCAIVVVDGDDRKADLSGCVFLYFIFLNLRWRW